MSLQAVDTLFSLQDITFLAQEGKQILQKLIRKPCGPVEFVSETDIREALRDGGENVRYCALTSLIKGLSLYDRYYRLYPDVVKIMGTPALDVKRLCFLFIILACNRCDALAGCPPCNSRGDFSQPQDLYNFLSNTTILTVNALQKDSYSRFHVVRAWALKVMSQLCICDKAPFLVEAVSRGVGDGSPFVRQITAHVVVKLAMSDVSLVGFVLKSILLRLINDIEDIVVAAALHNFYYVVLCFPELLAVDHETLRTNRQKYGLERCKSLESEGELDKEVPLLACLHPLFCQLTTHSLERLPFYGQVAGIYLLTCYCRTFFPSPDFPGFDFSGHYQLFLSKLLSLKYTSSSAVLIAVCQSFSLLAEQSTLHETLDEILPFIIHRIRVSTVQERLGLFNVLSFLADRCFFERLLFVLPLTHVQYHDPPLLIQAKLMLLEKLALFPDFPVESVCYDLLESSFWQESYTQLFPRPNLFNGIWKIIKARLERQLPVSLENFIETLLGYLSSATTPSLQENTLQVLSRLAQASRALCPDRLHSILLLIARHVEDLLENKTEENGLGGLTAAVYLFAHHYSVMPELALDVFRIFVKTMMVNDSPFLKDQELQIGILCFGASLYSFHSSSSVLTGQHEFVQVKQRIQRLWTCFLKQLQTSSLVTANVRDIARLCESYAILFPDQFFSLFTQHDSFIASLHEERNDDFSFRLINHLFGIQHALNIPDFVTVSDTYREVVVDTERGQARLRHLGLSNSHEIQQSSYDHQHASNAESISLDEEINNFYGCAHWGGHNSSVAAETFSASFTSYTKAQGRAVEGEEVETESDTEVRTTKTDTQRKNGQQDINGMCDIPFGNTEDTENDSEEWLQIKKTTSKL